MRRLEKVISDVCVKFSVTPRLTDFDAEIVGTNQKGKFIVDFNTAKAKYRNVQLNLPGKHQIENAKTAILLAETLQESGFNIAPKNIIEGLQTAVHKGRLEFYKGILFDGAHNVSGAKALRDFLGEFYGDNQITIVFGAMKDKNLREIAEILFPLAETLILTEPKNPRSASLEDLQEIAGKILERSKILIVAEIGDAIEAARKITVNYSLDKGSLICLTGSLYLVGEAQNALIKSVSKMGSNLRKFGNEL